MPSHIVFRTLRKVWARLPVDGAGLFPNRSQQRAAAAFWQRVPPALRPFAKIAARVLWLIACPIRVAMAVRRPSDIWPALSAGWLRGKHPRDTVSHRRLAGADPIRLRFAASIPSDRQSVLLLLALGNRPEIALATDKLRTAEKLAQLGLPVPPLHAVLKPGQPVDTTRPPWTGTMKLLLKPRHGSAAKGIKVLSPPLTVAPAATRDELLVQSWISPSPALKDLSPDAPPVIRAFTLRPRPNQPVSVVAAMLKILPPGNEAPHGINELLLIPIHVERGVLADGILFHTPEKRWAQSPWNSAPVQGRPIPDWPQIVGMAIQASQILPNTPVIGWDILLGPAGPVFLEANTSISLFRAMLWHFENNLPSPIPATLDNW